MGDPSIETEKIRAGRRFVLDHQGDVVHHLGDLGRKLVQGLLDPGLEPLGLLVHAGQGASAGSTSSVSPSTWVTRTVAPARVFCGRPSLPDLAVDLHLPSGRQRCRGLAESPDEGLDADLRLAPPAPADPDDREADLPDGSQRDCKHVPRGRQKEQGEDERDDQDQGRKYCSADGAGVVIVRDGVHLIVTGSQPLPLPRRSTISGMAPGSGLAVVLGAAPELSRRRASRLWKPCTSVASFRAGCRRSGSRRS